MAKRFIALLAKLSSAAPECLQQLNSRSIAANQMARCRPYRKP
jgi:hypothetical protein